MAKFEEGMALARDIGDRTGVYNALYALASMALANGDHPRAQGRFEEAIVLSEEMGDRANAAYCLDPKDRPPKPSLSRLTSSIFGAPGTPYLMADACSLKPLSTALPADRPAGRHHGHRLPGLLYFSSCRAR